MATTPVTPAMMSTRMVAAAVMVTAVMATRVMAADVTAPAVMVPTMVPAAAVPAMTMVVIVVQHMIYGGAGEHGGGKAEPVAAGRVALAIGGKIAAIRGAGCGDRIVAKAQLIGV